MFKRNNPASVGNEGKQLAFNIDEPQSAPPRPNAPQSTSHRPTSPHATIPRPEPGDDDYYDDDDDYQDPRRRRGWLWRIWNSIWVSTNVICALGLLVASYAGYINPDVIPVAGVPVMTLPGWIAIVLLLTVFNLIFARRTAIISGVSLLMCAVPIWNYCPLNIPHGALTPAEQAESFTLLDYNVFGFNDRTLKPDDSLTANRTMEYILAKNADIVCLGEADFLEESAPHHVNADQIKRLHRQYPYVLLGGYTMAFLSKYPIEALPVNYSRFEVGGGDFFAARVEIKGRKVTLFNCHFQSIGLTDEDKALYSKLTELEGGRSSVRAARHTLIAKLAAANRKRAQQAQWLGQYLQRYGGVNTIVCGDFNDVPDCYALRHLSDFGLKEVYPQVGFGPMITYNANRFLFRIDHVLYRGHMEAVSQERGSLTSSDHYPLLTTFVFTPQP